MVRCYRDSNNSFSLYGNIDRAILCCVTAYCYCDFGSNFRRQTLALFSVVIVGDLMVMYTRSLRRAQL
jgi:hypothetical protein